MQIAFSQLRSHPLVCLGWGCLVAALSCDSGLDDPQAAPLPALATSAPAGELISGVPPSVATPHGSYDPASGHFVVHEWGTFTSVVATDGTVLPGLHHEEEDLPGFVADRWAKEMVLPTGVHAKLETPVTYFYSPTARTVNVKVSFPRGIFTQWFPDVKKTLPPLLPWSTSGQGPVAPGLGDMFHDGLLDWGRIEILPPGNSSTLAGPLGDTSWHFARNTASNTIRANVAGRTYDEKFLFYRGLGNLHLPVTLTVNPKCGNVITTNSEKRSDIKGLFLINVAEKGAAFTRLPSLAPGARELQTSPPSNLLPFSQYVAELKIALTAALIDDGLYTDEAHAMVDTWERSYFLTPGVRMLYLLPRVLSDEILPLDITPTPDQIVRTMVIRVELLTREQERLVVQALVRLAATDVALRAAGRSYVLSLGRFAEPHLTRALQLSPSKEATVAGETLLVEIQQRKRWAPLAVQ